MRIQSHSIIDLHYFQINCYSTKFAPPKKETRDATLSINVKKFLSKKQDEEKLKAEEAERIREVQHRT